MTEKSKNCLFGLSAEFDTPEGLLEAAKSAKAEGYSSISTYSPFEIQGMSEAMEYKSPLVAWVAYLGMFVGIAGAVTVQYWSSAIHYPLNVAGRPLNPWPAYIPISFEAAILVAGISIVVLLLWSNGFPQPYHPIFNVEGSGAISRDRFYLCIEVTDEKFSMSQTGAFLEGLDPISVSEVSC